MNPCPECNKALIRASRYDPNGERALYGGQKELHPDGKLKELWVCINLGCEEGKKNVVHSRHS
jgi:hypothetical protein